MKSRVYKKLMAGVLSLAMLLQMGVIPVQASEDCPHHEHDDTCSYLSGTPCTFDSASCEICSPKGTVNGGKTDKEDDQKSGDVAQSTSDTASLPLEESVKQQEVQTMAVNESFTAKTTDTVQHELRYKILTESGTTGTVEVTGMVDTPSGSLTIPGTVTNGGITYTVTTIGETAFVGCNGFTDSLVIPDSVTTIGKQAFYNCSGFTGNLVVGSSVTAIGDQAFYGSPFTKLYFLGNAPTIGTDVFNGNSTVLYHEAAADWDSFTAYTKAIFKLISLNPDSLALTYGDPHILRPIIEPDGYKGEPTWTSSNKAVATVNNSGVYKGMVVAVGVGNAIITGTLLGETVTCAVTVKQAASATEGLKAYNRNTEATTFTYGDTITVKFTPSRSYSPSRSRRISAVNEAALFFGATQLTDHVATAEGMMCSISYDTTKKLLPCGNDQTLTVEYSGNANLKESQGTVQVTLNKADPAVKVTSSPASGEYGDSFTLTAEVTGANEEKLTGTVTFKNGADPIASEVAVKDGAATCQLTTPSIGTYSITAEFTPDAETGKNYNNKTSEAYSLAVVGKISPTITNKNYETSYTYTGKAIPSPKVENFNTTEGAGTVSFEWFQNNTSMGVNPPTGAGDYQLAVKTAGTQTVPSAEKRFDVIVAKATPDISVKYADSGNKGTREVVLTATLGKVGDGAVPTGTVKFVNITSGSDEDITGAAAVAVTEGVATYTWIGLGDQVYKVKAVYSGEDNYNSNTSEIIINKNEYSALVIGSDVWKPDSKGGITFKVEAEFSKFLEVRVNGKLLDKANYSATSGSTIIALKPEYLKTLEPGTYTIQILFTDGQAQSQFVIEKAAASSTNLGTGSTNNTNVVQTNKAVQTGDSNNLYTMMLSFALAGLAATLMILRKRKRN